MREQARTILNDPKPQYTMVNSKELRATLVRGGAGSVIVAGITVFFGLAVAVVLARALGTEGYGVYSYVYALVLLLVIPAQFGLPTLVLRETAKAETNQQWGLMRGVWRWAGFVACTLSLIFAVVGGILAWRFADRFSTVQLATFGWGLLFIPMFALASLRGAALRGLRKVVQGQLPESVIRPTLLLSFIAAFSLLAGQHLRADTAMALHALAAALAFVLGAWMLARARPAQLANKPMPEYRTRQWVGSVIPFAMIAGMSVINTKTDIVMLGMFTTASDVGVYTVAAQGANLVAVGMTAVGMVTMPYFARFHASGDMARFQKLATTGARASLLLALPVVFAFLFFGRPILRLVFGAEYVAAYPALAILCGANLVHAGFGTVGPLLNMSGYERDTTKGIAIAAATNIVLNAALIPFFGMIGAAVATAITLVIWNIVLWLMVRHRLGVDSSSVGLYAHSPIVVGAAQKPL